MDIRKPIVIILIGVLFGAFVFALIEAVYSSPEYEDYCGRSDIRARPLDRECETPPSIDEQRRECLDSDGEPREQYDDEGCVVGIECDPCRREYEAARDRHALIYFFIAAAFGAVAILAGFLMPSPNEVNAWIGSGLLFGGLIAIFGGTIVPWEHIETWLRPIILLAELVLVIFLAYRIWGKEEKQTRRRRR